MSGEEEIFEEQDTVWVPRGDDPPPPRSGRATQEIRRRDFVITFWKREWPVANFALYRDRWRSCTRQWEICPETQRGHWQVYLEFHDPQSIRFIKEHLFEDTTMHVEIRHSTREIARRYCMKVRTRAPGPNNGPFEEGTWGEQGKRTDLDMVKEDIDSGKSMRAVAEDNFNAVAKYTHGVKYYAQLQNQKEGSTQRDVSVHVYFGGTGTGKTRAAMAECLEVVGGDATNVFILDQATEGSKLWWCGYNGGAGIVIDDFSSRIPIATLLRMLDRYPYRCEIKGGQMYACWKHVWITTNIPPDEWTDCGKPIDPRHLKALMRRITHIDQFMANSARIVHKAPPPPPVPIPLLPGSAAPFT